MCLKTFEWEMGDGRDHGVSEGPIPGQAGLGVFVEWPGKSLQALDSVFDIGVFHG